MHPRAPRAENQAMGINLVSESHHPMVFGVSFPEASNPSKP